MANLMVDGQKLEFQQPIMDALIDNVERSNDYAASEEMAYVAKLFDKGFSFTVK